MTDTATPPAPKLAQMLQALAELPAAAPPPAPVASAGQPLVQPAPDKPEMTLEQLYAQFRTDMRLAGLSVYEVVGEMLGLVHEGPAVNVRDPKQATGVTHLTLATHALAPGLWRMYPVLAPIEI